jgi:hypothetical protein
MYEPTEEEEEKQERKRRVEAKMKSLMEERASEELMSVEEINRRVDEIVRKSNEDK